MPQTKNNRESTATQTKKLNREKHHQSHPQGALARLIREERKRRHPVEHIPFWEKLGLR